MILHLNTFQAEGGAGVAASRLNRALQKKGIDSHLLVYRLQKSEAGVSAWADSSWKNQVFWARFVAERLSFLPYEKDKSVRFGFSPASVGVPIEKHPLVQQADVINLHWINFGFLSLSGLEKLFKLGKPIVWTLHDMWAFTGGCHHGRGCDHFMTHCQYRPYLAKPRARDLSYTIFEKKKSLLTQAPITFVTPSQWLCQLTREAALTRHLPASTIPNPIDTSVFAPQIKEEVRARTGLPLHKKLILFTGANTQDPRKGYAFFRDAVNALNVEDLAVLVFGKSPAEAYQDLSLPVYNLGKLSSVHQIVEAYAAADVLVVSSLEDNLPNTVMEAMACGTPVVSFRNGGIPEMITHLYNGYLADYRSAPSIAEGINWVLDHNQQGELSAHARQKVLSTYAEQVVAAQYSQLYQSLL